MLEIVMDALNHNKVKPVAFHPYASTVIDALIRVSDDDGRYSFKVLYDLEGKFIKLFIDAGIKCAIDNKIVFECTINNTKFYCGFKDGAFTIGFGIFESR